MSSLGVETWECFCDVSKHLQQIQENVKKCYHVQLLQEIKGTDRFTNSPFGNLVNQALDKVNDVFVTMPSSTTNKLVKQAR